MTMRRFISIAIVIAAMAGSAAAREPKSKAMPVFPELAKRMNVAGTVKVEVVVAPNGTVKSAKALGGHPLLIDSAVAAAKNFKYEAAPEETKESLEFKFNSNN